MIIDGVERIEQPGKLCLAPLRRIGDALPVGKRDGLDPVRRVLAVVGLAVKLRRAMPCRLAPAGELSEDARIDRAVAGLREFVRALSERAMLKRVERRSVQRHTVVAVNQVTDAAL